MALAVVSLLAVKYWASLVTNRQMLGNLIRIYMGLNALQFCLVLWFVIAFFLAFKPIKRWNENVITAAIYPYYCATLVFVFPYELAILL
jgi:hypothetical protein